MDEYAAERSAMVKRQIAARGLLDPRLLAAFGTVPRHLFVETENWHQAYQDNALAIGFGQTISQPYIVALMTALLALQGRERVLEVGTGSGYQAAILSRLAAEVYTVELEPRLADRAGKVLAGLAYRNIHLRVGDGSLGWPEHAPYDGILVAAFAPHPPAPLLNQLTEGGRLVIPVGNKSGQMLEVWTRHGEDFECERIAPVAFVPLRGQFGSPRED